MTGRDLDRAVAEALGWTDIRDDHYTGSPGVWFGRPPRPQPGDSPEQKAKGMSVLNQGSTDIKAAWIVVEHLRDLWTTATDGVSGLDNDFARPFDDMLFFEMLHRNADRRWPWAMLYTTPEALCLAAVAALGKEQPK